MAIERSRRRRIVTYMLLQRHPGAGDSCVILLVRPLYTPQARVHSCVMCHSGSSLFSLRSRVCCATFTLSTSHPFCSSMTSRPLSRRAVPDKQYWYNRFFFSNEVLVILGGADYILECVVFSFYLVLGPFQCYYLMEEGWMMFQTSKEWFKSWGF